MQAVLLKVSNPDSETSAPAFLAAQNQVMLHLGERGLLVNVPIPLTKGGYIASLPGPGGSTRAARLLTFLPGGLLLHAPRSAALFTRLGAFLARVDLELSSFDHSALRRQHTWSPSALPQSYEAARPRLGSLPPERLALLEGVVSLFQSRLAGVSPPLRRQVIHTDCNEQNVLVDPADGSIAGLIDWGDCCYDALATEVAVAMAYAALLQEDDDPFAAAGPLLRGYESALPLREEERGLLRVLCMGRLAQSLSLGWAAAEARPGNSDYVLGTQRRGWQVLQAFYRLTDAEFLERCTRSAVPEA